VAHVRQSMARSIRLHYFPQTERACQTASDANGVDSGGRQADANERSTVVDDDLIYTWGTLATRAARIVRSQMCFGRRPINFCRRGPRSTRSFGAERCVTPLSKVTQPGDNTPEMANDRLVAAALTGGPFPPSPENRLMVDIGCFKRAPERVCASTHWVRIARARH